MQETCSLSLDSTSESRLVTPVSFSAAWEACVVKSSSHLHFLCVCGRERRLVCLAPFKQQAGEGGGWGGASVVEGERRSR